MAWKQGFVVQIHLWLSAIGVPPEEAPRLARTVHGRRLQAPKHQEEALRVGFQLQAVHAHRFENEELLHVRHLVDEPSADMVAREGRRLSGRTERDLILDLLKLSGVAYHYWKLDAGTGAIIEAGDSFLGSRTYSEEEENARVQMENITNEMNASGSITLADGGMNIESKGPKSVGVHALEFRNADLGTVLVYRGSFSWGDFDNLNPWIAKWILTRWNSQTKYQWVNSAGLEWTSEMQGRQDQTDAQSRAALLFGSLQNSVNFDDKIAKLARDNGLDEDKVKGTGYWEFTKVIAQSFWDSMSATERQSAIITGHSQGGSRAALTAMWYQKKYTENIKTITFSAVGGLCFSRDLMYTGANMLDDVNPYTVYDFITDYAHILDVYGNIDYDVGMVCRFGKTDIASSRAAKYCGKVFGHSGPEVFAAGGMGNEELANISGRCSTFTHLWNGLLEYLENETFLYENGTTDGGCEMVEAIPEADPRGLCPKTEDIMGDGCDDERSCETCGMTRSSTGLMSCRWCPQDADSDQEAQQLGGRCRASLNARLIGCKGGWQEPSEVCPVLDRAAKIPVGIVAAGASVLVGIAFLS